MSYHTRFASTATMIQLVEDDEAAPAHKRVRFAEKPSHEMPAKDAYSAIDQELARKKLKLGGQRTLLPGGGCTLCIHQ